MMKAWISTLGKGGIIAIILIALTMAACGPLILIWSHNVLVPSIAIPYTLKTWFAALLIMGLLRGSSSSSSK